MKVLAVLLDSRPDYLRGSRGPASLLLAPLGPATVALHLSGQLALAGHPRVTIVTEFEPDADYEHRIRGSGVPVEAVLPARELPARIADYEPSDRLVMIDPRCLPSSWLQPGALVLQNGHGAHPVRHLVSLEAHPGRTTERFQLNADGTVRRIQRFYDSATWLFTSGVACSILPISCTMGADGLPFGSLGLLRRTLAARGIPGNDVPIEGGAFDLSRERELLRLTEQVVLDYFTARHSDDGWLRVGAGCQIHPSARLVGPVFLQDGVVIGANATVVGPSVIGAGTRVGHDAMVAQCVVGQGSVISPGLTVRHCTVFGAADAGDEAAATRPVVAYELAPSVPVGAYETPDASKRPSRGYPAMT